MAVSKRLRYEVLRRDNHACRYCGATAPDVTLTVDHVLATALGGSDEPGNLVAACSDCNSGKSATPADAAVVDDVQQDALRWAAAMQAVIAEREADRQDRVMLVENLLNGLWDSYQVDGNPIPRSHDSERTVEYFLMAGLTHRFVEHAIRTAMGTPKVRRENVWRYLCGICWREIEAVRDATASRLKNEPAPASELTSSQLESPLALMRWMVPSTPLVIADYGSSLAKLTRPDSQYWSESPTGTLHRAWAPCWTRDHLTVQAYRSFASPCDTPPSELFSLISETSMLWADVMCGTCCAEDIARLDAVA